MANMEVLEPKSRWGRPGLICVVEDDTDVAHLISHTLLSAGYSVSKYLSAASVIEEASLSIPSVFLLDIMLPGINGLDLCRQIRQHERLQRTPIIFLSARNDETDRLEAFDAGADGYLTKPFSPRELVARIHNVVRIKDHLPNNDVLQVADIDMDTASMTLRVAGIHIATTAREFRLLEYLIRNRGRIFSREQLLDAVWKDGCFVTPRSIDVFVRRLREKIESDPRHPCYLKTHRGVGYRFEVTR